MKLNNTVLICGKDGVGKSTLAGQLAVRAGDAIVMAVASTLREMLIQDEVLTREEAYTKPTSDRVRTILRAYSSIYKTQWGPNIFADRAAETASCFPEAIPVIVHDVRYLIEVTAFAREMGWGNVTLIYIGDAELSEDEAAEPSFQDLPDVKELADIWLPEKPHEEFTKDLVFF